MNQSPPRRVRTTDGGGGDDGGGATVEYEILCCSKKDLFRFLPVIFIVLVVANVYIVYHRGILGSVDPYRRAPRRTLDQQIQELLADDPAQAVDIPKVHPYHKADHAHADPLDLAAAAANANDGDDRPVKRPILAPNPIHDPVAQAAGGASGNGDGNGGGGGAVDLISKDSPSSSSFDVHVRGDGELNKDTAAGAFTGHGSPYCLDTLQHHEGMALGTYACHGQGGSQAWEHRGAEGPIANGPTNLCIGTKGREVGARAVQCENRNHHRSPESWQKYLRAAAVFSTPASSSSWCRRLCLDAAAAAAAALLLLDNCHAVAAAPERLVSHARPAESG